MKKREQKFQLKMDEFIKRLITDPNFIPSNKGKDKFNNGENYGNFWRYNKEEIKEELQKRYNEAKNEEEKKQYESAVERTKISKREQDFQLKMDEFIKRLIIDPNFIPSNFAKDKFNNGENYGNFWREKKVEIKEELQKRYNEAKNEEEKKQYESAIERTKISKKEQDFQLKMDEFIKRLITDPNFIPSTNAKDKFNNGENYGNFWFINKEEIKEELQKRYNETKNEEEKKLYKNIIERLPKERIKINYKGEEITITEFSKKYEIPRHYFISNYNKGKNLDDIIEHYRAIQRQKNRKKDKDLIQTLENCLHLSKDKIEQVVNMSNPKGDIERSKEKLMYEEKSLYQYCLDKKYNYGVILYDIKNQNKTIEQAISRYEKYGQELPNYWIYEEEIGLLKHKMLNVGIDSNKIIAYVKEKGCDLYEAIIKEVISQRADKNEKDYLYEVYSIFPDDIKTEEIKEANIVNEEGLKVLKQAKDCEEEIVAMEISSCIDSWDIKEINEIIDLYDIENQKRIERIFFEYPIRFENGILNQDEVSTKKVEFVSKWGTNWNDLKNENYDTVCYNHGISEIERNKIEKRYFKYLAMKENVELKEEIEVKYL